MQPSSLPQCSDKRRLLEAYQKSTTEFADRLTALNDRIGTSTKTEYEPLRHSVDEARVASEHARLELERHIQEHGC